MYGGVGVEEEGMGEGCVCGMEGWAREGCVVWMGWVMGVDGWAWGVVGIPEGRWWIRDEWLGFMAPCWHSSDMGPSSDMCRLEQYPSLEWCLPIDPQACQWCTQGVHGRGACSHHAICGPCSSLEWRLRKHTQPGRILGWYFSETSHTPPGWGFP